jgi:hypothetical protein
MMKEKSLQSKKTLSVNANPKHQLSLQAAIEKWCQTKRTWIIFSIIAVSLLFRGIYFSEINATHLVHQHKWSESDMFVFDEWAQTIAAGDILSTGFVQKEHQWMKEIATIYFNDHPDKLKEYQAKLGNDTLSNSLVRLLWKHWYGEKVFPHEPLYTYFLALNYRLFGHDVRWIFFWQLLLGVLTNLLVYLVTRRYFGDFAGLISAFLVVFCGPLLFFEMVLLRSSFACFISILIVYLCGTAVQKNTFFWWLISGVAAGIAIMVHAFFILFVLLWIFFLIISYRKSHRTLLISIAGILAGTIIGVSPVLTRNAMVGAPVLSMSNNSAIGFITMNNDTFISFNGWLVDFQCASDIMASSDGKLMKTVIPTLKTHKSVSGYLAQIWDKFHATFSWFEIPNNVNFYFYREFSFILKLTFISFLFISPLALAGLFISVFIKKLAGPLYLMILVFFVPMLAFMVLSRYRIIFAVVLIPFAALTLAEFFSSWKGWKNYFILLGLCIFGYWAATPGKERVTKIPSMEYSLIYEVHYVSQMGKYVNDKNWDQVTATIEDFIQGYEPARIRHPDPFYRCRDKTDSEIFNFFAWIHGIRSQAFLQKADTAGAAPDAAIAARLKEAAGQ